jgi:type IV pilus assembly protein PilY1
MDSRITASARASALAAVVFLLFPGLACAGTPPSTYRFGFTGSTGGASNIHEIVCKAQPDGASQSSGSVNVFENPTLKPGTQMYLAYYFPSDWTGKLTAQGVVFDPSSNQIQINSSPTWDARCVLSGASATKPCSTGSSNMTAQAPSSRTMLTWNGTAGVPFEWSGISANMQSTLDAGDPARTGNRLDYLRGITTNEITSAGSCPQLSNSPPLACFRKRDAILGDIVDSSPTWVGPAQTYDLGTTFADSLHSTDVPLETSYDAFRKAHQGRLNVVYVGANDGFLHGFRSGYQDASGALQTDASRPNDGQEVLAYMPGVVFNAIHNTNMVELDYSNTRYAHAWYVDATPATGDLFYAGNWHTWLVGGLGPGGAAIYALDVTNPGSFSEGAASTIVVGEWSAANLTCYQNATCKDNLGNTYGTPLIRRFHNGSWGVIFGNGFGSSTGAAGIYIMMIDVHTGMPTFYYLATPATGNSAPNGIASPASADLDLDHIVDYIYAGDLQGNVWRFDVTSTDPTQWAVTSGGPLYSPPAGSTTPIVAGMTVSVLRKFIMSGLGGAITVDTSTPARVIVNFGTGQYTPLRLTAPAQYATGTQYLLGVWDWNFNAPKTATQPGWNSLSNLKTVAMDPGTGAWPIQMTSLQSHTIATVPQTPPLMSYRTVSREPVCWVVYEDLDGSSSCPPTGNKYGWYEALPGAQEQIIFNPVISPDGELVINTFIPSTDSPLSCQAAGISTGFTLAVMPGSGTADPGGVGSVAQSYFKVNASSGTVGADGVQLNGTGIPWFLSSGKPADNNSQYLLTQTGQGAATPILTYRHTIVSGKRLNWIQRR